MWKRLTQCLSPVDDANNLYFTGTLRGLVDCGGGVVSDGLTLGTRTITIVAFSPSGTPLWSTTSQPGGFVSAQAITAFAETNAIHFAGHISSDISMGGHTTNTGGMQAALFGRVSSLTTGLPAHDRIHTLAA